MKAVFCETFGPPEALVLRDVPEPEPKPGEVSIEVKACALNFPDALIVEGKYQHRPPLPFCPGAEIAGVVRAVGAGVSSLRAGQKVISTIGYGGGLCEVAVASVDACWPLPEGLDFVVGAALLVTYSTMIYGLKDRGQLRAGETVLVLGAGGGIGLAAIQIAKVMGAKVVAAASSQHKVDLARAQGADAGFVYGRPPFTPEAKKALSEGLRAATGGGADVIVDPVGGEYSESALRIMNWEGRFLVVGFAVGEIPRVPLNLPLLKGCAIVGVEIGGFCRRTPERNNANVTELSRWVVEGKLKPHVSAVFPLARTGEAMRLILNGQAEGKIVIVP